MVFLDTLTAYNFLSWKELDFDFKDKNLCLIVGPNGAGKSSIPSAVAWVFFGRTQKGLAGEDIIKWETKQANARLTFKVDDIPCMIIRHRGNLGNDLEVIIDGEHIKGANTEKQKVIINLIGANFETFIQTCFFSQGKIKFLGEITDRERKDLFKQILDLSRFDKCYTLTKEQIVKHQKNLSTMQAEENNQQADLRVLSNDLHHLEDKNETFEKDKATRIQEWVEQVAKIETPVGRFEAEHRIEELQELVADKKSHTTIFQKVQVEKIQLEDKISAIKRGNCPTCGRPYETNSGDVKEYEQFKIKKDKAEDTISKLSSKIEEYEDYERELISLIATREAIRARMEEKEKELKSLHEKIKQAKNIDNPLPGDIFVIKDRITTVENDLIELQKEIKEENRNIQYLEEAKGIFSKSGVISYIMENYFRYLSYKTNFYLSQLDIDMTVDIKAQKELKSGETSETIDIIPSLEGHKAIYEALSDGQRKRLDICLTFSIHNLCSSINRSSFNCLFLDEILDLSLDEMGKDLMVRLLDILKREEGVENIFVISHDQTVKERFDNIIRIENQGGKSTINE